MRRTLSCLLLAVALPVLAQPASEIEFVPSERLLREGPEATVEIELRRRGALRQPATVSVVSDNRSAKAGRDFERVRSTVAFAAGESRARITLRLIDDALSEPVERFQLQLADPEGARLGARSLLRLSIQDDDPEACREGLFCVGAASRRSAPTPAHLEGVMERRLGGQMARQRFHLGGFGFGPIELFGPLNEFISNPPATRAGHCPGFALDCGEAEETLYVRVLALSVPPAPGVLLVGLDAVGAGNLIQDRLKAALSAATGVAADDVLIGQSHSHAGADLQGLWGGVPQDWVDSVLVAQAVEAAREAQARARAATLTHASGRDGAYNNYRRPRVQPDARTDEQLGVLQARDSTGAVIATLVQYSAHPTSIGTGSGGEAGRAAHPDYPLGLELTLERATGAPALFFNGVIADASPAGATEGEDDYARVFSRGRCLAQAAQVLLGARGARLCDHAELDPASVRRLTLAPSLDSRHVSVPLPITNPVFLAGAAAGAFNRYYNFTPLPADQIPGLGPLLAPELGNLPQLAPVAQTLVSRITLGGAEGGLELISVPGEATGSYGESLRQLAATPHVMWLGLTQNSLGYILPEEEFSYLDTSGDAGFILPGTGYEEFVSTGPLAAPLLRLYGYSALFGITPEDPRFLPPGPEACTRDPQSDACSITRLAARLDYTQKAYARLCRDNLGVEPFCALLDPDTPLSALCQQAGFAAGLCSAFGEQTLASRQLVACLDGDPLTRCR